MPTDDRKILPSDRLELRAPTPRSKCARCPSDAAGGFTRCDSCRAKDRDESRRRYVKRGGWGGARVAGDRVRVETEGNMVRVTCRCGARISGTFDPQEVVAEHARVCPLATARKRVTRDRTPEKELL